MQQQLAQKDRRSSPIHHKHYDALILGGGFSACLLAARILRHRPNWHIALIEESSRWGGRHCAPLTSSDALQRHHRTQVSGSSPWGYGLHGLPQESMQLIQNTFEVETPADDSFWPLESLGYLQGSELHQFALDRLTSPQTLGFFEGPKQGARLAAEFSQWQQQWAPSPEKIQHLLHKKTALPGLLDSSQQAYPRLFEHLKNAPKGGYFHSLARYLGLLVEDFLHLDGTLLIFTYKLQQLGRGQTYGPWDQMIHTWAQKTTRTSHLHLLTRTALTQRAFFQNNLWHTPTTQGEFSSRHLIVAQHCWKASSCVDISQGPASWSSAITRRSLSSQPTSMICLIARISSGSAETLRQLPQVTWLARQHAHVLRDGETLIFQALLPYENTLHAPRSSVMVRRLRRALQNLSHHLNTPLKEHFLTVLPYASPALHSPWTQPSNKKTYPSSAEARLFFCGSSYGAYPEEWQNRWRSIDEVTTKLH